MNRILTIPLFIGLFNLQCLGQSLILSKQQAMQDFDFFVKTLEEKHPNPSANFPNYREFKDSLFLSFSESISYEDFARTISKYANLFQDGHTFASNVKLPDTSKVLPIDVIVKNNRFFIIKSLDKDFSSKYEGAEIISINQKPIEDVISIVMPYLSGETAEHKLSRLAYGFAGFVCRVMGEILELGLHYEGSDLIIRPTLIERSQWLQLSVTQKRPVFEYISIDSKTSLILFSDMANLSKNEFKHFLTNTFKEIKNNNIENLIIDLRHNGGGNFLYGQMLIAYLTDKPYIVHDTYQYDILGQKVNRNLIGEINPKYQKNIFSGNLFFLTSPYTYSSAASIIAAVKFNGLGKIIGKPVGQPYTGFIDMATFKLPNSKLLCGTSTVYYEYAGATDINKQTGIQPDIDTDGDALEYLLNKLK